MAVGSNENALQRTGSNAPSSGNNPPGLSPGAGEQSAVRNAANAQALTAAQGQRYGFNQTQGANSLEGNQRGGYKTEPPPPAGESKTPAKQETAQAGQTLHDKGVTSPNTLSAEQKANLQSKLDNSVKKEQSRPQEGSRLSAARQEAASAPPPSPSPSPSMQR